MKSIVVAACLALIAVTGCKSARSGQTATPAYSHPALPTALSGKAPVTIVPASTIPAYLP